MISSNVQEIYDMHIAGLSAGERLRLVEMITRGMGPDGKISERQRLKLVG